MTDTAFYWVAGPWPSKLAILPRPRGGEWLSDEVQTWAQAPIDVVVSLLTISEEQELGLQDEQAWVERHGLTYIALPIKDRQIPDSLGQTHTFLKALVQRLMNGQAVGVHCRQGIGRSALIVTGALILYGLPVETALARVAAARGCQVPETAEQRQWLERLAAFEALTNVL